MQARSESEALAAEEALEPSVRKNANVRACVRVCVCRQVRAWWLPMAAVPRHHSSGGGGEDQALCACGSPSFWVGFVLSCVCVDRGSKDDGTSSRIAAVKRASEGWVGLGVLRGRVMCSIRV